MQLVVRGEAGLLSNHTDMLVENALPLDSRVQAGDCAATSGRLQAKAVRKPETVTDEVVAKVRQVMPDE